MKRFYKFLMPLVAIVAMALPWNVQAQLTTIVADGTNTDSYVPVYGYYADAYLRCQSIYPVDMLEDLTPGSVISSLTFYSSSTSVSWGAASFEVILSEETETTLSGYITPTAPTTVYTGSLSIDASGLMTVNFTTPYTYTGGNLMVEIDNTVEGTYVSASFYGISSTGSTMQGYSYSDISSVSANQRNFLAKMQIEYTPGSGDICYRVRNLAASGITADGVTLTWFDTLNNGASYTIYNMADSTVLGITSDTTYTVTGLTSNTLYNIGVMADCGSSNTSSYATIAVRTACGGYTAVPYVEGFEDYTTSGNNPNCWMQIATGSSGSGTFPSVYNYSSNARNGNVYYEFESSNGATEIAALPAMANISSLAFTFYASVQNQNFVFEVGVLDDTTFEVVDTITLTTSTNWHNGYNPYTVYFANYAGVGDRIAMRVTAAPGTSYTLMLDDFTVEEFDGCYPVSNVQITDITPDGMTVTWDDELNSGVSYNVYYRVSGNSNDTTVVNVTTNSYTLTGLDSYTRYYFAVEVDCGSGSVSDVSPTVNARTLRACPQPTELTIDSVTTDMITLSWTPGYQETSWVLGINDSLVEVTTNPYTITDLTSNTAYTLTLRALCGDGDTSLVSSINTRTDCENGSCFLTVNATDSYGDGWNGNAINFMQGGTSMGSATISSGSSAIVQVQVCSGDSVNLVYVSGSYPGEMGGTVTDGGGNIVFTIADMASHSNGDVLATVLNPCPACMAPTAVTVDTATVDEITLHWTAVGEESSWNIMVNDSLISGVTTNPYTITGLEQYTLYSLSVAAVCSDDGVSGYTLPVTVRTAIACPWPTNFNVTTAGDTATFTWTDALGSNWELVYGPMGFNPSTGDIEYPSTTSYEVTGLTTGFYDAYVRTNCGDSYSVWTGPVSFTIGVDVMNMATSGTDTLYTCAAIIYDNGGPSGSYSGNCDATLLLLPNTPGSEVVISGSSYTESTYDYLTIYEGAGTSGTVLWTDNGISTLTNFGPFTAPSITVVFHSDDIVQYDGFQINVGCTAPADCPRPTLFTCTSSTAADSVVVIWSDVAAANYELAVGTPGFNPDTVTAITTTDSSYLFTTLLGGTTYEMYIRANCGADGYSNWTGPLSVVPGQYTIGTSGSDTISMCGGVIYDNGGATGDYSSSADYTLVVYPSSPDSLITFQGSAYLESSSWDYLRIYEGVGTDGALLWQNTSTTQSYTIAPDTSLVGPITLVFHSDGSGQYDGFELFINCVEAPNCLRPYSVTAPSVLADQVTIDVNGTATAHKAYITDGTTVDSVSFTGTTYTFTGLTPLTTYTISVASDCGTETSDLTSITVTTTMVAATLPYSTGFEAGQDVAWFLENGTQTNQWVIDSATNNGGSHALYISNDNGASNGYNNGSTSNVFAYKVFTFDTVGDYGISFDWKANGESCCDYLRVFLAPGSTEFTAGSMGSISSTGAPTGWIALDGGNKLNTSSNWQNRFEIISIPVATNYTLVFFWHNDGSVGTNPPAAIDNVQVGRLSCSTPTALTVSNVTGTSADIAWTPGGDESQWEISLNGVSTVVTTPAYNAMGLSNSTNYNVTVRSICGAGDTSFAASTSFTTEMCDIFTEALNYDTAATATTSGYSPIGYSLYNYSYIQTIITADRMASIGGDITAMAFNAASTTSGDYFTNMSVYMANVSEDNLADGPILPDSAHTFVQVVNNSDFTFTTTGWQTHAFDTPFHWDGSSNVLVAVKRDNGSWGSTASFVAHEDTVERMYYAYQDSDPVDITTATASYTSSSTTVGDIKLISCGAGCATPTIVSVTADDNTVTVNWTGSASDYEVAIAAGNWVEPTVTETVMGFTTTFTGLASGTFYSVGVRAACDSAVYSNWYVDTISTTEHPCYAPTAVTVTDIEYTEATVNWTPAEEGQTDFQVRLSHGGDTSVYTAEGTSYTLTGLVYGQREPLERQRALPDRRLRRCQQRAREQRDRGRRHRDLDGHRPGLRGGLRPARRVAGRLHPSDRHRRDDLHHHGPRRRHDLRGVRPLGVRDRHLQRLEQRPVLHDGCHRHRRR